MISDFPGNIAWFWEIIHLLANKHSSHLNFWSNTSCVCFVQIFSIFKISPNRICFQVGFGDIVPAKQEYFFFDLFYIVVGLAITFVYFNIFLRCLSSSGSSKQSFAARCVLIWLEFDISARFIISDEPLKMPAMPSWMLEEGWFTYLI